MKTLSRYNKEQTTDSLKIKNVFCAQKKVFPDKVGEFLFELSHKMTNEWIDYAENVHVRTPFKYPANTNSLITNNNSFLTTNMHHQPQQQFYNKMGIKPFNNNLNNNNSNALNQYSLVNKFQKPSRGELIHLKEGFSMVDSSSENTG